MNRSVFISYAHADTPFVVEFAQLLVSLGVPFWRDAKDLAIGANLSKSIYEGIKASSHFCCVLSTHPFAHGGSRKSSASPKCAN